MSNTSGYQASLVECSLKLMPSFDSAGLNIQTDCVVTLPFLEGHSLRGHESLTNNGWSFIPMSMSAQHCSHKQSVKRMENLTLLQFTNK